MKSQGWLSTAIQKLNIISCRPGWSQECTEQERGALCSQVLSCLLEVVSAFHIGRGGTSMSFMGKGVTKAATLCLRHLVYEMATLSDDQVCLSELQWSLKCGEVIVTSDLTCEFYLSSSAIALALTPAIRLNKRSFFLHFQVVWVQLMTQEKSSNTYGCVYKLY